MNKTVYLGLTILNIRETVMYKCLYNYIKPKYKKTKLCYMDRDSFIVQIKTDDLYVDIAKNVEMRFHISN